MLEKPSRIILLTLLVLTLGGTAWLSRGGEAPKPGKLSKQEQAALRPGLTLRFARNDRADTRRARGDATFRVYWTSKTSTTEPLPPELLFSRGDEPDLVRGEERREGRLLFATRGCSRCHALPANLKDADIAMPELKQRAPSL